MNTVYFFTDTVYCEGSPGAPTCRILRQMLTDLGVSFITKDLHRNRNNNDEIRNISGRNYYTPYIIIRDSSQSLIFHFGYPYINELIRQSEIIYNTQEEYNAAAQEHIKNTLILYNALSES